MRCYFHLADKHEIIPDDTGVEVSDVETARRLALKAVHELRQESDHADEDWVGWQLEVVDADGNRLLSIPLDMPLQ
jgi:hypothetical protein